MDNTGGNELNESLSDAALSLDSNAPRDKDTPGSYGTAEDLISLWAAAGLRNIEVKNIVFPCGFDSFDDFWQPLTEGQGPAGAYLRRIQKIIERRCASGCDRIFLRIALMDHLR